MKFADKLKDVEKNPFMLAVYKDNKYHHLLHHALIHWNLRRMTITDTRMSPRYETTNPILFSQYPPIDLVDQYNLSPHAIIGSKHIKCPIILKRAMMYMLVNDEYWELHMDSFWLHSSCHVAWDDELIFECARAGLAPFFFQYNIPLTEEQRSVLLICA